MVDPQQRLALELTWEALEHAHIPASDLKGGQVGVFIGSSTNDYQMLAVSDPEGAGETAAYASPARPHPSSRAGCRTSSTSAVRRSPSTPPARHRWSRSIRPSAACATGESDVALAGGVNMLITPAATLGFDSVGVQSKDGTIKAFSSDADGMIRAEGGGLVVLKRLVGRRRDGDKVLARGRRFGGQLRRPVQRTSGAQSRSAGRRCCASAYTDAGDRPARRRLHRGARHRHHPG